jgi:hypothetical protein
MAVRRTPNILWRIFALVGIGTMTALAVSDEAWEQWEENVGDVVPRSTIRAVLAGTLGVHVAEAAVVHRSARRAGLDHPGRWAFTTLLYGFPVMFRLRKAKRSEELAVVGD